MSCAPDGKVAGEILRNERFDAVLSDISMPTVDGIELLRTVREYDLDIPVILMTGTPEVRTAIKALEHGALRYLTKPIDNHALVEEIGYAVRMCRIARLKREALAHVGDLDKFVGDRAGLESRFRRALEKVAMAYQPIVSWAKQEVYAYEALVRTSEPTLPHPGALFDAAERIGRLRDLGRAIRGVRRAAPPATALACSS